jgi:hypothetical protein
MRVRHSSHGLRKRIVALFRPGILRSPGRRFFPVEYFPAEMNVTAPDMAASGKADDLPRKSYADGRRNGNVDPTIRPFL